MKTWQWLISIGLLAILLFSCAHPKVGVFSPAGQVMGDEKLIVSSLTGAGSGSVFVARRQPGSEAWIKYQRLRPSQPHPSALCGSSHGLSDEIALVACPFLNEETLEGGVFVFVRARGEARWIEVEKLIPGEAQGHEFAHCGWDVSLQGQTILLSCVGMRVDGIRRVGTTYVYEWHDDAWKQTHKLIPSEARGREEAHCGYTVSLEGNLALITCLNMEESRQAKTAYVFERTPDGNWKELGRITPTMWAQVGVAQ